jgi:hypothetical protein
LGDYESLKIERESKRGKEKKNTNKSLKKTLEHNPQPSLKTRIFYNHTKHESWFNFIRKLLFKEKMKIFLVPTVKSNYSYNSSISLKIIFRFKNP